MDKSLECIQWRSCITVGDYNYSFGATDSGAEWVHINNFKTNKNSVIIRDHELREGLGVDFVEPPIKEG